MGNEKALNDDALSFVSGGAKTPGGFETDDKGNVKFVDKNGDSMIVTASNWDWLKKQYNDPNPEEFIKQVTAKEIKDVLNKQMQA